VTEAVTADEPGWLLDRATDHAGRHPQPWMAAPLRNAQRVLELGSPNGLLAAELGPERWIGLGPAVLPRATQPGPFLRADPAAVPLATNAVDGVALLLALPVLADLDAVFAELRRVLRPGGTLVVVVPSASPGSWGELRLASMLRPVHRAWPHRSALDGAGWLLTGADFAVLGDDRVSFTLPVPDAAAAHALVEQLPAAGLWPPDLPDAVRAEVAAGLARRAGPQRVLPVPLRRLVARR
jgi:SAM-dependent methyltransferase